MAKRILYRDFLDTLLGRELTPQTTNENVVWGRPAFEFAEDDLFPYADHDADHFRLMQKMDRRIRSSPLFPLSDWKSECPSAFGVYVLLLRIGDLIFPVYIGSTSGDYLKPRVGTHCSTIDSLADPKKFTIQDMHFSYISCVDALALSFEKHLTKHYGLKWATANGWNGSGFGIQSISTNENTRRHEDRESPIAWCQTFGKEPVISQNNVVDDLFLFE